MRVTVPILLACSSLLSVPALAQGGPEVHWGVAVGVAGQLPVGGDVAQDGAAESEFELGLALQADLFTFDVGAHWQVVPFFRATVLGGGNADAYAAALGEETVIVGDPETRFTQIALGARYLTAPPGRGLRPFVGAYLGYLSSSVTYAVQDVDPSTVPEPFRGFVQPTAERREHEGLGVTLGLGLRSDAQVSPFAERHRVPIALEVQWTHGFWLGLEESESRVLDRDLVAGESMSLDMVNLVLSIGYLI
jgi:hypothetical protein